MDNELIERLGGLAKEGDAANVLTIWREAATQGTADNERIAQAVSFFDDIKQEALTAGAPGQRTSARAFAHIVRLCIDARAILEGKAS